jgi:hypothetical protein
MTNNGDVKYPEVVVKLSGQDGNANMILGLTRDALKKAGVPQTEINTYMSVAKSGDYENLIETTMRWVTVV